MDNERSQNSEHKKTGRKNGKKMKSNGNHETTEETLDQVCREMSKLAAEPGASCEGAGVSEGDDLVNSINYNTITSLAALKDILQGDGNDTPEADTFFQHYFMNHCNNLSSRASAGSPFPFPERRRLSQCREEDEEDDRRDHDPPPSNVSSETCSENASRSNLDKERSMSDVGTELPLSTQDKRTVMGAKHKFFVTPTQPPPAPALVERALRSQVHNSHTVHFGTKGAEEQRPSVRTIFPQNLHRDKHYFDSSLVEIRSSVDGVTASQDEIWVKRADVKPKYAEEAKIKSPGSDKSKLSFDDITVERERPRAGTWSSQTAKKELELAKKNKAKDGKKDDADDRRQKREQRLDAAITRSTQSVGERRRRGSADEGQPHPMYQQTIHGTTGVSRRPALLNMFKSKPRAADAKKQPSIMRQVKAAVQNMTKSTPTKDGKAEGKSLEADSPAASKARDGSAHAHTGSDTHTRYYHTVTAGATRRPSAITKVMDIFRSRPSPGHSPEVADRRKASVSCTLGGQWSGTPPSCKYVDCGTPAQLHKGSFRLLNGTTTFGSVAQFSCEADHWLASAETLVCNRDGKWSHDIPHCELITCTEPEVPAGGYMEAYDYNVHSTIDFHCEHGHRLLGESSLLCRPDGEWSGDSPKCEYVDCGKLPPLPYGSAELVNGTTHLGSVIQYSCTTNYRLVGPVRRQCGVDRQWTDTSPRCEEIRCPEPIVADNSIVSVTGNDRMHGRTLIRTTVSSAQQNTFRIGALVKYRCERGYKVVGESLSSCEDNGSWSGVTPKCQYVDCGNPSRLINGKVTLATNATYYGATALYECEQHWQLDGVSRRLCQDNGTWSSEAPLCKEITCVDPAVQIKDSIGLAVASSTRSIGGEAHYRCDRGYVMKGNQTRVCLPKGQWKGQPPVCIPIDCKSPTSVDNGRTIVANSSTLFGSSVEYHCLPQYQRIGPFLRKCSEDGRWSGEEPRCEVASSEAGADAGTLPYSVGVGCGVVLLLLVLLGGVYLKLQKATPVKNTENIEGAERKEDQNAAVMSYATLHDTTGRHIYDCVSDNVYDSPYGERLADNAAYGQQGDADSAYEPEPTGPNAVVTINGVAVR